MENVCKSCTVIANASPDSEKHPTIGRTRINNVMSVKHIPPYASPNSFLLYHFACSFSPAPMQRPITVTIASPIAIPGILANPAILFATAFAAIAAVPNVAVRLDTRSLPIWNIPFSIPLGIPIFKIFPITSFCGRIQPGVAMQSGLSFFDNNTTMTSADTILAISVASAAPITPIPAP